MQITYKFRLYPNSEKEKKLLWTLEKCREVYNQMLEELKNRKSQIDQNYNPCYQNSKKNTLN